MKILVRILVRILVTAVALAVAVWLVPGIHTEQWVLHGTSTASNHMSIAKTLIVVAVILTTVNGILGLIAKTWVGGWLFLFNVISFGLFTIVINVVLLYLVSSYAYNTLHQPLHITTFLAAVEGGLIVTIVSLLLNRALDYGISFGKGTPSGASPRGDDGSYYPPSGYDAGGHHSGGHLAYDDGPPAVGRSRPAGRDGNTASAQLPPRGGYIVGRDMHLHMEGVGGPIFEQPLDALALIEFKRDRGAQGGRFAIDLRTLGVQAATDLLLAALRQYPDLILRIPYKGKRDYEVAFRHGVDRFEVLAAVKRIAAELFSRGSSKLTGRLEPLSDDAMQLKADSTSLPVSIYLTDASIHDSVEAAVSTLLGTAGLSIKERSVPVIGSWFRWMSAEAKRGARSRVAREAMLTAAHKADAHFVLAEDAAITATLLQNLAPLIASLQPTKDAVARVGALLIVKIDWTVQVYQLTAAQQVVLNHRPTLASSPQEIVAALELANPTTGESCSEAANPIQREGLA